jgi:hypothetical protein
VFSNVQAIFYWSSSTYADITGYAWSVYMDYGYVDYSSKAYGNYVWPVRGGQLAIGSLINGSCGGSNGQTLSAIPTSNLCSTGNATTVTGNGPWNWTCSGSNGGNRRNMLGKPAS